MEFMHRSYYGNSTQFFSRPFGVAEPGVRRGQLAVKDLTREDFNKIAGEYGALLEDVCPLTAGQAWLFCNEAVVSADFCIQALFKVNGDIEPENFNERVNWLIQENEILRTAFFRGGDGRVLRILLKSRTAEIRFHDLNAGDVDAALEKILAADRRRGFDLTRDRLLRIGVFRTGKREYAVLLAQPQLIADGWDFGQLFSGLFETEGGASAKLLNGKDFSFTAYLEKRGQQDKGPARQYWKQLLDGLGAVSRVPGVKEECMPFQRAVSTLVVDEALTATLRERAGGATGFLALLQTAWGVMLQRYNDATDAVFGVLLSNRSARIENIEDVASIINVMPVRVSCAPDTELEALVKKQRMQLVLSQPYSYCAPSEYQELSGLDEPLFGHMLNFHSFGQGQRYSEIDAPFGVTPVQVYSLDYHKTNLRIYFRLAASALHVEFVYHNGCIAKGQIELLQQGYAAVLRQFVQNPRRKVGAIKMPTAAQIAAADKNEAAQREEIKAFIKEIELFANLSESSLEELAASARCEYFVEGDVVYREGERQEKLYLVYAGNIEMSRTANHGWAKTLGVLKRGGVMGYDGIFGRLPSCIRAEALLGDVILLAVPYETIHRILAQSPALAVNIITELSRQVNKFQKLWISADVR